MDTDKRVMPDFDELARKLVKSITGDVVTDRDVWEASDCLVAVWNARGAADLTTISAAVESARDVIRQEYGAGSVTPAKLADAINAVKHLDYSPSLT